MSLTYPVVYDTLPKPSPWLVFNALTTGLDGVKLPDGSFLKASSTLTGIEKASDELLPYLLLKSGSFQSREWDEFMYLITWDIPGVLKIRTEPGQADVALLNLMGSILGQLGKLRGLYVDSVGKTQVYSEDVVSAFRVAELAGRTDIAALAVRGGPTLRSFSRRPESDGSIYAVADLVFHVEFILDQRPAPGPVPQVFSVGTIPRSPGAPQWPNGDPYVDFGKSLQIPAPAADTRAQGKFAGSDQARPQGTTRGTPPFGDPTKPIPTMSDVLYTDLVKEIGVSPASTTIAHTSTVQLTAIAFHVGGQSEYCTNAASWSTSDATKATVSATGLVSGVAAGSCTITASYSGASNTCLVTLT